MYFTFLVKSLCERIAALQHWQADSPDR